MTTIQVSVLGKATRSHGGLKGVDLDFLRQLGCDRQVKWLVSRGLCYIRGGRLIANKSGVSVYSYQTS
jgi:hypothetical protein